MRQANWNELFAPRMEPLVLTPEVPQEPQGWRRLLWWEDLVTLALLGIVFLAVIVSIDRARWVDDMPSLYPIALFGLLMGTLLARLRWPEGLIHLVALPIGMAAVLGQVLAVVPGAHPVERYQTLTTRMGDWFAVAFGEGISGDSLPFIVLVVALTWLAAYLSAWAVFRWQNAWLGLIPGGWALLANISNLPGQFSFAFVVFLFGAALLVTRLHLMGRAKAWRASDTPYPAFLSLSVLHTSIWTALVLVALAWILPQADQAGALESVWEKATAPVTERFEGMGRLFVSVNTKESVRVHSLEDVLPFLGSIELPDTLVLEIETEELIQPAYLRAKVYDVYTPAGWERQGQEESTLGPYEITRVDEPVTLREPITIRITSRGRLGDTFLTVGQPRRVDRSAQFQWQRVRSDVTALQAEEPLGPGSEYETVGSVSVATVEDLRAAGADYPDWIRLPYLQLPDDFPAPVRDLARGITGSERTPYDRAAAIETYLRDIPYDLDVPDTPRGRDTIEYFLFEARRGYFDYHASAMVVMLRSIGIPSRLAVGYVLQESEREPEESRYLVTELSAFAWPEVYFPGLGWVDFNPSPNLPAVERPGAAPPVSPDSSAEPGLYGGDLRFEDLMAQFSQQEGSSEGATIGSSSSDRNRWVLIGIAAGMAAALVVAAGGARYAWVRGLGGLESPARYWGQTVRLASWARLAPDLTNTPREQARALREQVPGVEGVDVLADAYVRHQFGRKELGDAEREALEDVWRGVRGGLLRRLLRLR